MSRKYFGTDGVRGRVGQAPITPDFVMRMGNAAGRVLVAQARRDKPKVLIGKDTRVSGYLLQASLEAGFSAAGVDVMLAGPMPTSAIAYLTRTLSLDAGVVISASHNPFYDNGIKFFSASGTKLPDDVELGIEALIDAPMQCRSSESLGKASRLSDAAGRYIEFCKGTVPYGMSFSGLKVVVDCANGAAYHIAGSVFSELGANVITVANQPDGFNINSGVGATHPEYVRASVLEHKADIGFALDGDADRLIVVDSTGRIFNGDELLYILAMERLQRGSLSGVVGTLMSNVGLELALKARDVAFDRAKVGDRYVHEMLIERGWSLGGEGSGHLLFLDRHTTGDGILSALQILIAMLRSEKNPAELTHDLQMYPQILKNVKVTSGYVWTADERLLAAKKAVDAKLVGKGRTLIRPSGTEPLLRIMVEAHTQELAVACVEELMAAVGVVG
ncbi:MAG: phosphoglucosamine mutase [Burkholderiales bacterium]|nr:phosphoglucosamine mutase [Burkholderiales bacterium]